MVDKNTTIEVIVSSGPGEIDIPNVVGQDEDAAISALQNAGFSYSRNYEYSTDVARGKVISQNPTGQGKEGDTITIVVSQGVPTTTVPGVIGDDQATASSKLQSAGLSVGNVTTEHSSSVAEGKVIRQSVGSGTTVDQGTRVDLVISSGPETVYYRLDNYSVQPREAATYYVLRDGNGKELNSGDIGETAVSVPSISDIEAAPGKLYYYTDSSRSEQIGQPSTVPFQKQ